jgi:hypothetical protein
MSRRFNENDRVPGRQIEKRSWTVRRHGKVEEVSLNGAIRFRVSVWDHSRDPFLVQWFNDVAPASDFLHKLIEDSGQEYEVTD